MNSRMHDVVVKKRIRESVFEICSTMRGCILLFVFGPGLSFFFPLCPELIMANFYGLMLFFMHFGLVRLRKKIRHQCYHDYNFAFI